MSGITDAVMSTNYVEGRLTGAAIDHARFLDGGAIAEAFVAPVKKDFWPRPGSVLIGRANASFTPELDFSRTARKAPYDVGAQESDGRAENPGWKVRPGFKDDH